RLLRSPDDPNVPIGPSWLVQVAIDVTALGGTTVLALVLMIVVGYLALEHRYDAIVLVVVATAGGGLLNEGLKWWFARKRPEIVPHLVNVGSASFPSGHSMLALVTYLTLGALLVRFVARRRRRSRSRRGARTPRCRPRPGRHHPRTVAVRRAPAGRGRTPAPCTRSSAPWGRAPRPR